MAYKLIRKDNYIADSVSDLAAIPEKDMGSYCYVIENANEYRLTSKGEWVRQTAVAAEGESSSDLTNFATKEEVTALKDSMISQDDLTANGKQSVATAKEYTDAKAREVSNKIPSISGLATTAALEEVASNPILKMFDMSRNSTNVYGVWMWAEDSKSIAEAMREKGIGFYTLWVQKGHADLPKTMKENNLSGRGFCCVDYIASSDSTDWIGWIVMFDKQNNIYTRFINHAVAGPWMKVGTIED